MSPPRKSRAKANEPSPTPDPGSPRLAPPVLAAPPVRYHERNIRLASGDKTTYEDVVAKLIDAAGTQLCADQEYPITFLPDVSTGARAYNYINGKPAVMFLVGEVCGTDEGTALGTAGNKNGGGILASGTCVRIRLRLRVPTHAPEELERLFARQLAVIDGIAGFDEEFEESVIQGWAKRKVWSSEILYAHDRDQTEPADMITVVSEPIFATVENKSQGTTRKRARHALAPAAAPVNTNAAGEMMDIEGVSQPVGGTYPLSLMEGHAHRMLSKMCEKVVQLNIRDVDGSLVKPWDYPAKLKRGTLVIVAARPMCYVFDKEKFVNKYYSLVMSSCRIMAESPDVADDHSVSTKVNDDVSVPAKRKADADGAAQAEADVEASFRRVFGV
ncbi:hypothetical protein C8F01DRAFT_1252530 [Mycena amicta]|nr:hypothetical protein C8F01DRAFT_1252530 [Mycena amicta]